MSHRTSVHRNDNRWAGTPEWYTPRWLLARIADFYGGSYFDPCPASQGVIQDNGLIGCWRGKQVYCNPPYGRDIVPWVRKAMTEPAREIILLVPAYTETHWFSPLYDHTICFVRGRIWFEYMGGKGRPAPHPSVLVYRGRRWRKFADAFSDLGPILRTAQPMRDAQPRLLEVPA